MTDHETNDDQDVKTPLSFKLMVALTAIYLGWRLIQGIMWVIDKIAH